jgi:hypothetical protein
MLFESFWIKVRVLRLFVTCWQIPRNPGGSYVAPTWTALSSYRHATNLSAAPSTRHARFILFSVRTRYYNMVILRKLHSRVIVKATAVETLTRSSKTLTRSSEILTRSSMPVTSRHTNIVVHTTPIISVKPTTKLMKAHTISRLRSTSSALLVTRQRHSQLSTSTISVLRKISVSATVARTSKKSRISSAPLLATFVK